MQKECHGNTPPQYYLDFNSDQDFAASYPPDQGQNYDM